MGRGCKFEGLCVNENCAENTSAAIIKPCSNIENTTDEEYSRKKPGIYCAPVAAPSSARGTGLFTFSGSVKNPSLAAPARCNSTIACMTMP